MLVDKPPKGREWAFEVKWDVCGRPGRCKRNLTSLSISSISKDATSDGCRRLLEPIIAGRDVAIRLGMNFSGLHASRG
ncbi:hypothetical protein SF83666_b65650 (plasmid) [Sinorhizobium fredii CCBAU 83666]|nr:hypothetical protein SF83666_b65650 [Sinorhizobium fredii CCBAU 83666]GLS07197.1 hypothetical protein GCM10007864_08230 [Sinorhizobium fredii]